MEYSLSMLALVYSLVLIPKNAQAAKEDSQLLEEKFNPLLYMFIPLDEKPPMSKNTEKNAKSIGSFPAIKGDELKARFAKRKAGSQSFKDETIEQKLARRKAEALLLAEKEPEQTFQGLRKKFDG